MGKVVAGFAMSLDGFIADADDGVWALFGWLVQGDTPVQFHGRTFMTSAASAAAFLARIAAAGAHVTGRRDFEVSQAWGGKHPFDMPVFIVTHTVPAAWAGADAPFAFVTAGVAAAVAKAQAAAGAKDVLVAGSKIVQQGLDAGLIDEIQIDLVPVLLGKGIRLFEQLAHTPITLEATGVVAAPGVTHLTYRVVRKDR
jgi:dihydrofolate reductase